MLYTTRTIDLKSLPKFEVLHFTFLVNLPFQRDSEPFTSFSRINIGGSNSKTGALERLRAITPFPWPKHIARSGGNLDIKRNGLRERDSILCWLFSAPVKFSWKMGKWATLVSGQTLSIWTFIAIMSTEYTCGLSYGSFKSLWFQFIPVVLRKIPLVDLNGISLKWSDLANFI